MVVCLPVRRTSNLPFLRRHAAFAVHHLQHMQQSLMAGAAITMAVLRLGRGQVTAVC